MQTLPKLPLSVVLITRDAERTLLQTLLSVLDWAGDIVVVDSGSTDDTVSIARMFGCRVFHRAFEGYGSQKQFAIDQAAHDWVLLLDADEVLDTRLQEAVCRVMAASPDPTQAYSLPRSLVFMNRELRHSGEHRRPVTRLFHRQYAHMSSDRVHERVLTTGGIIPLGGTLLHYSYASLHDYLEKMNRYTTLSADTLAAQNPTPRGKGSLWMALRFLTGFTKIYVLKAGFLDGFPGMVWALLSAMYPVVKYTKQYEKTHQPNPALGQTALGYQ